MYIAISGNLGSGKSTVAQGLSRVFNCPVYPRHSYNKSYIDDLYREPARWTTEAQISFLVHKHDEVRDGIASGRLFVLDRSFDEETKVFAERFHDDGTIDARSMDLIRKLAGDLGARLELPELIVLCDCSVAVCAERLSTRPRSYQSDYPTDHLSKLEIKLKTWATHQTVPVLSVDTGAVDYRERANILDLAQQIDRAIAAPRSNQLDLFSESFTTFGNEGQNLPEKPTRRSLIRPRQVYLAAPFTARAQRRTLASPNDPGLFPGTESIEGIPSSYRRQLSALASAIESHGHDVLLPHRDINRWGRRSLPASEIAHRCLQAVTEADCFIGLIGESFGSHAELGYALGLGKPALILRSATIASSFFGAGMAALADIQVLQAPSLSALVRQLKEADPLTKMTWRPE